MIYWEQIKPTGQRIMLHRKEERESLGGIRFLGFQLSLCPGSRIQGRSGRFQGQVKSSQVCVCVCDVNEMMVRPNRNLPIRPLSPSRNRLGPDIDIDHIQRKVGRDLGIVVRAGFVASPLLSCRSYMYASKQRGSPVCMHEGSRWAGEQWKLNRRLCTPYLYIRSPQSIIS